MILIIDNYDSFVQNLARYVRQLCLDEIEIVRNDCLDIARLIIQPPTAIIISPGPCGPAQSGVCPELVRLFLNSVPMLGVCLGHQVIVQALGGVVAVSGKPMHGKSSQIFHHHDSRLFNRIPSPFAAGRYHSLTAEPSSIPSKLRVTAHSDDGFVMAVEHRTQPLFGVQFHPESVLTEHGYRLLANFLEIANVMGSTDVCPQIFA